MTSLLAEVALMSSDLEKAFGALEQMRRARLAFEINICRASLAQDEIVLDNLRLESMFEYAEFFFTLEAMDLKGPNDIGILADLHNQRITKLTRDSQAMRRRGLTPDRLHKAIFTSDTRPRLEQIWREQPGALDQSNLARFLVMQMSFETTRKLTLACEAAGFVTRLAHPFKMIVVSSTGMMERLFERCMLDMLTAISRLAAYPDTDIPNNPEA